RPPGAAAAALEGGAAARTARPGSRTPCSAPSADRTGHGEAAEAAPAGQHGGEVAPPPRDDDVDVVRCWRDRQPGRGVAHIVARRIAAGLAFHAPELLVDLAAGADLGGRAPGALPEVLPDAALRPPPPRELLGVQRVQDDERLAEDVDVVVAEGAQRAGEHVEHLLGSPVADVAVRAHASDRRHR